MHRCHRAAAAFVLWGLVVLLSVRATGQQPPAPAGRGNATAPPPIQWPSPPLPDGPLQFETGLVRPLKITGLVCGPCTPAVVTMIDGRLAGNTITFYINHIDTPPDAARQGIQRNVMTGTIGTGVNANVMRFTWVREQSPGQGGEIVMFGPLR